MGKNKKRQKATSIEFVDFDDDYQENKKDVVASADPLSYVVDMREYDVPYTMRVSIDLDIRVGSWYIVYDAEDTVGSRVVGQKDRLELCEPRVLAFDIECEKLPLKFPNSERDRIYMISYMTRGQGYLLINR